MSSEIIARYVSVADLRIFQTEPTGPHRPTSGMLMLPWVTGIGKQARRFAETITEQTGAVVVVWDPWHGPSSDDTERAELSRMGFKLNDDAALEEQERILSYMRSELGLKRIGVAGWCLGGRFAFILGARHQDLANVIAFHPTVTIPPAQNHSIDAFEEMRQVRAPALLVYPGKDSIVSHESFQQMQEALHSRGDSPSIIQLYPQAMHGFSDSFRHDEPANISAHELAWPQALTLMRATLKSE